MTTEEARECVSSVLSHLEQAREALLALYNRRGWIALNYTSWSAMITGEFGRSRSFASRQLAAALLEQKAGQTIGSIPEYGIREIRRIFPDDEDMQVEALNTAINGYSGDYTAAAMMVYIQHNAPDSVLRNFNNGDVSIGNAYDIIKLSESAPADLFDSVTLCTDPELAQALLLLPKDRAVLQEVIVTGCIPQPNGDSITLSDARMRDLVLYLEYASREHKLAAVQQKRQQYWETIDLILEECRSIITDQGYYFPKLESLLDVAEHLTPKPKGVVPPTQHQAGGP